jgi:hypothetical protein
MTWLGHAHPVAAAALCGAIGCIVPLSAARAGSDADALALADTAVANTSVHSNWTTAFELAAGSYDAASQSSDAQLADNARVSSIIGYDGSFAPDWRAVFANRLDVGWRSGTGRYNAVDTLKQVYVSWQPSATTVFDLGRVNLREGVAVGLNPTDFFKTGALRTIVSIDPKSLRENRLGAVMLRGQALWSGGSLSAVLSPRLGASPSRATFSPDFAATNGENRYLVSVAQKLGGAVSSQWLLYGGESISPQLGVDLSALLGSATTAFLEYAGGRGVMLADGAAGPKAFRSKLAVGLTHTFPINLSATIEYDYDGASADRKTWRALAAEPGRYWQYRRAVNDAQELMTREAMFAYVTWQDAFVRRLDLTEMLHFDLVDRSWSTWTEARYHWPRVDLAVQWEANFGALHSNYGAAAQSQVVQTVMTIFF